MKNTETYNELVQKMRTFFQEKGFKEVPTQSTTAGQRFPASH